MPVDTDSREKYLARLREAPLDVLVIGGGINGAGIARDLALRNRRGGSNLRIVTENSGNYLLTNYALP